jgi:hypothetical protein
MKIITINLCLCVILFFGLRIVFTSTAEASTAQGWELVLAEYLGPASGCTVDQGQKNHILMEYNSLTPITNVQGLQIKSQVFSLGTGQVVRESTWVSNTNISPAMCYNPISEDVKAVVMSDEQSIYHPFNPAGWTLSEADDRPKYINRSVRGQIHMQLKSAAPTIELRSPINTFITTSRPTFVVTTNSINTLYQATAVEATRIKLWQNGTFSRYIVNHGGVAGTRAFSPATLSDGLYTTVIVQQLNGENRVKNFTSSRITDVAGSSKTLPVNFYIDSTLPTASVTLTGSSTQVESRVNAVVNVRDVGSGMRSFNLVLIPTRTPQNMASVTVPFAVGTGLIGGPKDQQTARLSLRVLPGTDYQYYVVATDVAGNRYQTPRQTLRTDNVYADLDASNFRITSTCLPADVGGDMSAICPLTRADVRMNNVGGREITAGTQVPYRIESQPSTGGSWSTVTTGNYSGGLQPGALSNAIPLSLTNLRGGSRLRLVVNLAPQLNNAIGEQNFANNTSAPLTLTFRQEPPKLLLEVDRTVVRVNETVSIRYEIESPNPVSCELKDGGNTRTITHTTGTTQATVTSTPIANSRTITLSCTAPDGTVTNTSANVSVVPNVQEV